MSLKILVVDDSPTERWFLADLIAKGGYQVTTAANGEEALEMVRSNPPSLIVLDVVMPGQSGFQLTRTLARDPDTQSIPIILCSSKNSETDRIWGLRQGASAYLTKPVRREQLLERIAQIAQGAQATPAAPTAQADPNAGAVPIAPTAQAASA
ncbi:MAG TPA: response regulator [Burkholderiaceae bacterium]|nr:response regulator [Burkholderiaceae bacterium]